jgi:hypothetical protein
MRARNVRWQKVAGHGLMPSLDEGVTDCSRVFASDENLHGRRGMKEPSTVTSPMR